MAEFLVELYVSRIDGAAAVESCAQRARHRSKIRESIREERKVKIAYSDEKGQKSERIIWPIALAFFDRARELSPREHPAELHLPQPILGVHEALGQKQVLGCIGVDVRYAVSVPQHLNRSPQPRHGEPPGKLGERLAHRAKPDTCEGCGGQHQYHHAEDQPARNPTHRPTLGR